MYNIILQVKKLYVFQRTPCWTGPRNDLAHPAWLRFIFKIYPPAMYLVRLFYFWAMELLWVITNYKLLQTAREGNVFRSVILSRGSACEVGSASKGGLPLKGVPLKGGLPLGVLPPESLHLGNLPPGGSVQPPPVLTSNLGHCSSRYASYWNAILLRIITRMHSSRICTACSISRLLGGGGICLSACWDTPPGCGPGDPPGVGLETPSGQTPQLPPWVWAWRPARHAGIPPVMHAGIPPPLVNRILDTRFWKYYLAPTSLRAVMIVVSSHYFLCHWNCKRISAAVKCEDQTGWWKYYPLE